MKSLYRDRVERRYMKKLLSFMLIFTFIVVMFSGCTEEPKDVEINASNSTENTQKQQSYNFDESDGYKLFKAELVSDSRLVLFYINIDKETCRFRQYDLKSKSFTHESEEFSMNDFSLETIYFLSNNFYILSENSCFVFDFDCNLVEQLPVPENVLSNFEMAAYWLSDDLKTIAYVKNPNLQADYLYIADSDGKNEKQIRELKDDLVMITNMFFSEDYTYIGLEGGAIPQGSDTSVDCYGYINLKNYETTVFQDDRTYAIYKDDMMLICDKMVEYGEPRRGIVKTLDLKTKERKEIATFYADECEAINFASDTSYMVGMHKEEETHSFAFTIYKDGKKVKEAEYVCPSENVYTDICSILTELRMDMETKQIMVFYYNSEQQRYDILTIPFE